MENFKINRFEDQDRKQKISEFQTLSLEHLNHQSHISQEQLQDFKNAHEVAKNRTHEAVLKIYEQVGENYDTEQEAKGGILEKNEIFGRDSSGIIQPQDYDENIIYLSDYRAKFANYEGRDDFIMRADQHQTQAQLDEAIDQVKGLPRNVSFGQKLSNVMKAVGLQKAA